MASGGFESTGPIGRLFERGWIRQLRAGRHATAFIGYAGGVPVATGVLVTGGSAAGLYSGSVLPRSRSRGFQKRDDPRTPAVRLRPGVQSLLRDERARECIARNVRDVGFVSRFEVRSYVREAG